MSKFMYCRTVKWKNIVSKELTLNNSDSEFTLNKCSQTGFRFLACHGFMTLQGKFMAAAT